MYGGEPHYDWRARGRRKKIKAQPDLRLALRLCCQLGCTLHELTARLSSEEFTLWKAFYSFEPWGSEVNNWRMGQIAATIVNAQPRARVQSGQQPKAKMATDFYVNPYKVSAPAADNLSSEQRAFLKKRKKLKARKMNG